jgi:hypothetical protein
MKITHTTLLALGLFSFGCANVPIGSPKGVAATDTGVGGNILVKWGDSNATQYRVERTDDTGLFKPIATVTGDTAQYEDTAAPSGSRYRVLAFDDDPRGGTYSKAVAVKQ